ncbi:Flp family type IVb pilin [Nocardioides sp. Soil805]|nr:Flp family type IVb pilin [Nocardioides sp. Soil805]
MAPHDVEDGATSVEYALMCTMIAVVISGSVAVFGTQIAALFAPVLSSL